ncbi:hypothetical protein H5410_012886 [Solanum commersonii]|uniref:Uncharacterized protein n=1 Tax=Solanum commersonii TaxID=4109 RepID=A0A9J6ATE4_SOLCO|nr:hypothetical protein H5410_012886 [Solanum commersonii]
MLDMANNATINKRIEQLLEAAIIIYINSSGDKNIGNLSICSSIDGLRYLVFVVWEEGGINLMELVEMRES